jgi:ABC-2 type transport system ATP-binding protein
MVQRLHIARCLINEPKIIFLDEPTIGLDPIGARLLRDIVKELAQKGITIILTTHYMQEADDLCDRIAFIKNGAISLIGEPTDIKESCSHLKLFEATMQVYDTSKLEQDTFLHQIEVSEIKAPYCSVSFQVGEEEADQQNLTAYLSKYGEVIKLEKRDISLEDAYVHHMKDVG